MARPMNVARRAETLLEKAAMHHNIAMRSQLRYAARPESKTGQLEFQRMRKHDQRMSEVLDDLKKLLDNRL